MESFLKPLFYLKNWIYTILPFLAWCGIIIYSSSQPYTKQDLRPTLSDYNLSWVESWFSWVSFHYSTMEISIENIGTAHFIEFFIRKGAHLFVFMVLGILIYRVLRLWIDRTHINFLYSFLFILIFASIDEYRHLLHPYRTGLIEDVIIDCIGGLIGLILWIKFDKGRNT